MPHRTSSTASHVAVAALTLSSIFFSSSEARSQPPLPKDGPPAARAKPDDPLVAERAEILGAIEKVAPKRDDLAANHAVLEPLVRRYVAVLDKSPALAPAEYERAASLAISRLYFSEDEAAKNLGKGGIKLTVAILDLEGALVLHMRKYEPKDETVRGTLKSIADRLLGDLLWYQCYKGAHDVWDHAAKVYASTLPSERSITCSGTAVKRLRALSPGNPISARTILLTRDTLATHFSEDLGTLVKAPASKRAALLDELTGNFGTLEQLIRPSGLPSIPEEQREAFRSFLVRKLHPTLDTFIRSRLLAETTHSERIALGKAIGTAMRFEATGEKTVKTIQGWGFDFLTASSMYPSLDKEDRYGAPPLTTLYLDLNRIVYTGDTKVFQHAVGFKVEAVTQERARDFSRNAFTVSLAAGNALSPDDSFQTTVGVLFFQVDEQMKRGPYGMRFRMHPEAWAEHAAELLQITGGKKFDATEERFFEAKAGIWKRALLTGYTWDETFLGEKRTVKIEGLWSRYRTSLPDYILDQHEVRDADRRADLKKHPNFIKLVDREYGNSREKFAEIVVGRLGAGERSSTFLKSLDYSTEEIAAAGKKK